jgi:AraC family transcriptional regulator
MTSDGMAGDVEIRVFVATRVAYMRFVGPYGSPGIPEMWRRFASWCAAHELTSARRRMFGVAQDNPNITPPDQTRYDACVEVDARFEPSGEVGVQMIPGGRHACVPFHGTAPEIRAACVRLLGKTLPDAGYDPELAPAIELYDPESAMDPETGAFSCLLCMPVRDPSPREPRT